MRAAAGRALPQPFPWAAVIAFGLGRLRLSPAAFWALTPVEAAALMGPAPARRLSAEDLASLMAAFPDHKETDHDL